MAARPSSTSAVPTAPPPTLPSGSSPSQVQSPSSTAPHRAARSSTSFPASTGSSSPRPRAGRSRITPGWASSSPLPGPTPSADLDKDGQTSLLEAFLIASKQTADYYKSQARLSSEHALIDDNADGKGTPADWFEGTRLTRKPKDGAADGLKANQFHLIRTTSDRRSRPRLSDNETIWNSKSSPSRSARRRSTKPTTIASLKS